MDANNVVENLIAMFLMVSQDDFRMLMEATESEIRQNHLDIINYLDTIGVDKQHIDQLKKELKI